MENWEKVENLEKVGNEEKDIGRQEKRLGKASTTGVKMATRLPGDPSSIINTTTNMMTGTMDTGRPTILGTK